MGDRFWLNSRAGGAIDIVAQSYRDLRLLEAVADLVFFQVQQSAIASRSNSDSPK
jgi:hypothetical protein